eukprot:Sdes_comp19289_c0_seq3m10336
MDDVGWSGVVIASSLLLTNGLISFFLELKLIRPILISSLRLVSQLTLLGFLLKPIFHTESSILVLAFLVLLITLSAYEVTYNKSKFQYTGMFINVFSSIFIGASLNMIVGKLKKQDTFFEPKKWKGDK